jgi:hypothetical protein
VRRQNAAQGVSIVNAIEFRNACRKTLVELEAHRRRAPHPPPAVAGIFDVRKAVKGPEDRQRCTPKEDVVGSSETLKMAKEPVASRRRTPQVDVAVISDASETAMEPVIRRRRAPHDDVAESPVTLKTATKPNAQRWRVLQEDESEGADVRRAATEPEPDTGGAEAFSVLYDALDVLLAGYTPGERAAAAAAIEAERTRAAAARAKRAQDAAAQLAAKAVPLEAAPARGRQAERAAELVSNVASLKVKRAVGVAQRAARVREGAPDAGSSSAAIGETHVAVRRARADVRKTERERHAARKAFQDAEREASKVASMPSVAQMRAGVDGQGAGALPGALEDSTPAPSSADAAPVPTRKSRATKPRARPSVTPGEGADAPQAKKRGPGRPRKGLT